MHSDARESFRENGFLFPVQFLNEEEKIFYENKYNEYAKIYGSSGEDSWGKGKQQQLY